MLNDRGIILLSLLRLRPRDIPGGTAASQRLPSSTPLAGNRRLGGCGKVPVLSEPINDNLTLESLGQGKTSRSMQCGSSRTQVGS